jgi:hypothetical protein
VPLLDAGDPGATVSLFTFGSRTAASAFRTVRVVDTIAPTIDHTEIDIQCGWIERATNPRACLRIVGATADRCAANVGTEVLSVAAFDAFTGELLREVTQPACIERLNGYPTVEEGLARVVYVLRWRSRDGWGNASVVRRVVFAARLVAVRPGDPPPRCPEGDVVADIVEDRDE